MEVYRLLNHCRDVCWRSMFAVGMAPAWHMPTANISDPDRGIAVSFQVVPPCDSPLRIAKFTKPAAPPTTGKFRGRRDSGVDSGTATRPRYAPPPSLPLLDTQTVLFRTQQQRNYEQPAVAAAAVKATVVVAAALAEATATSSSQCVRVRVSCRLLSRGPVQSGIRAHV